MSIRYNYRALLIYVTMFCLLACIVIPTSGVYAQKGPGYKKYREAMAAQKAKRYDDAVKYYDEAINLEKTQYKYYFGKGYCLTKLKEPKYQEAIQAFTEALKVNPGLSSAYVYIAQIYVKQKEIDKALENYNLAYEKEQDLSKKIVYKITAIKLLSKQEKHEKAMSELQTLKGIAPDDLRVFQLEGDVYGNLGQWDQALEAYQKAVKKATAIPMTPSEIARFKFGEGLAFCRLGKNSDYERIVGELKSSSSIWAKRLQSACKGGSTKLIRLALAYLKVDEYEEALKYIENAIEKKR